MTDATTPAGDPKVDRVLTLEAENARLRARLAALEAADAAEENARDVGVGRRRAVSREADDLARSVPTHAIDELDQVARGLAYAAEEAALSVADTLREVADRAFGDRRGRTSMATETSDRRYADNTADDVVAGISSGLHRAIDGQKRVVQRFYEAYTGEPEGAVRAGAEPVRNRPRKSAR